MTTSLRKMTWAPALACGLALTTTLVTAQSHGGTARAPEAGRGDILVHGAWVIDVRNADGSLASHVEFQNALTFEGGGLLAVLLAGRGAVASLLVELDSPSSGRPCGSACLIVPNSPSVNSSNLFNGGGVSKTLAIAAQMSGDPRLVLSGVATATQSGEIRSVRTLALSGCTAAQTPCAIPAGGLGSPVPIFPLTETTLAAPIPVANGQAIQVTVTLSFSS